MSKIVKKHNYSNLSRKLMVQYIISIVGFLLGLLLLVLLAWRICHFFTWYETDPLYRILYFVEQYILLFIGIIVFVGWTIITYIFLKKPLSYLDSVIEAAENLALTSEQPVELPQVMIETQNELNLVRETALRNAATAKEAERRKNDLIVYLAHDLKTPLTSVIGYLTLLKDEPQISTELRAKYTGIALSKAERLEELINEFFDITRFNLTTLTLEQESVNLSLMLEQITYEFNPVLKEKELEWNLSIAPNIQLVCDPNKLERVIDNLLRNAVNYSYNKSAISVSLVENEDVVTIVVKNRGKTIPKEKLSRIFEQFFRLDSSRASTTGGAGLGLAISKEIVELHGGTISAQSEDESITFTVNLPSCHKIV